MLSWLSLFFFFFFNDTATTEIYTLSLHDALPISRSEARQSVRKVSDALVEGAQARSGDRQARDAAHARLLVSCRHGVGAMGGLSRGEAFARRRRRIGLLLNCSGAPPSENALHDPGAASYQSTIGEVCGPL